MDHPKDWEQMPFFLAVARAGSLRAAADALGTSHVKVSRHLGELERLYGVALVRRSRKGVELTEAGLRLLPLAEEAELTVLQARRSLQGLDQAMQGRIRFSVSRPLGYFVAAPIIAKFTRAFPKVDLTIDVSTQLTDTRLAETDVSLRMVYDVHEDAIVKKLFPVGLGTFAHRDYLADRMSLAGQNGEGLDWVGGASGDRPQWVLTSAFPNADLHHLLGDPVMFLELAAAGLGMAKLAAFMAAERAELQKVPGTEIEDGPPLCILMHPDVRRVARVRRFVTFLEEELRRQRPLLQYGSRSEVE